MQIDPNKDYIIPGALLAGLAQYLASRPYAEVAAGMQGIAQVQPVEDAGSAERHDPDRAAAPEK